MVTVESELTVLSTVNCKQFNCVKSVNAKNVIEKVVVKIMTSNEWYNKGSTLHELRRFAEALDAYNKALEINPDNAKVLFSKGTVLKSLMRYDEALDAFNMSLEINPHDAKTLCAKAELLMDLAQYEEALDAYSRAVSLAPEDPEIWYRRGLALREMRAYEDAMDDFEKAIRLYVKSRDMSSMSCKRVVQEGYEPL